MKNAIIFDFDGVIVDSESVRYETYRQLFRNNFSVELPKKMENNLMGKTPKENMIFFLSKYNCKGVIEELICQRAVLLKKAFSKKENIKPIQGLFILLEHLKSYKIKMAIASSSNNDYICSILNRLGLENVFCVIISGEMVSKGKPDPEIFLLAAKKLGEKREDCIVIEDSYNGILSARAAGMKVVAVTSYFSQEQLSYADMVVDDLSQIKLQDIQIFCPSV